MKVSIIIPCHNEEDTIAKVIEKTKEIDTNCKKDIIVVDDGSTDRSLDMIKGIDDIKILLHEQCYGKGRAVNTGIKNATGEVIVIQDADMEYLPSDIPRLIDPILHEKADVIYGSRFKGTITGMSSWHRIGNFVLTLTTRLLFSTDITDVMTGHKAFRTDVLRSIDLEEVGFSFEIEVTAKILKKGYKIYEIPISYERRKSGKTKISWKDGFKAFFWLLKSRLTTT